MRRVLLDAHALLWWLADDPRLPGRARRIIGAPDVTCLASVASLWEIAIKVRLGKLEVPPELPDVIVGQGFGWMSIEPAHAWSVAALADHHRDPFDRMLVAQALSEGVPLISRDERLADYGVELIWH